jgi:hypothetical protein
MALFEDGVELECSIGAGADAAFIRAFEEFKDMPAEASETNARR